MSAWVLPDHIADVLPSEARHIEELRRSFLDTARTYGYELVIPPLMEHLDSLLSSAGQALDLQTFKLVDQLSGRSLGVRADTTPQVARLDAHLLNRSGIARLCYCGPVLHTKPDHPHATREPLQFGAEIYGHAGIEAECESMQLALACVKLVCKSTVTVDLNNVQIVEGLLRGVDQSVNRLDAVRDALAHKDKAELSGLSAQFPAHIRQALLALTELYGDQGVLKQARKILGFSAVAMSALDRLEQFSQSLQDVKVHIDLSDLGGYSYYSGLRFAIFVDGISDALVRGGRYDEVGSVFGRSRPAAGFSLDVKQAAGVTQRSSPHAAICAPFVASRDLDEAIAQLRAQGKIVVRMQADGCGESSEFSVNQILTCVDGKWVIAPLSPVKPN